MIALAGNKIDLVTPENPKAIKDADIEEYKNKDVPGLICVETSAKTGKNVKELFTEIAKKLPLDQAGPRNLRANARPGVDLRPESTGQQASSACQC